METGRQSNGITNNNAPASPSDSARPAAPLTSSSRSWGTGGGGGAANAGNASSTMVLTQQQTEEQVLRLALRPQPHVTWEEGTVNNEGMGRKSSKRCCIFHKARGFGESSTESSEDDSGDDDGSTSSSGGGGSGKARKPMARKKNGKKKSGGVDNTNKVPDYQRFHA